MFFSRLRRTPGRFTYLRVGLFFFASGLWLAGVLVENQTVTAAAIGVAVFALLLGVWARRLG